MSKKLVIGGAVVVGGAIVVIVWARGGSPRHEKATTSTEAVHATGIDQTDSSVSLMAMINAPEDATPCGTAYLAFEAEQAAARLRNAKSLFKWVAPKPEFLAGCQALTQQQQKCMMPRYRLENDRPCVLVRPPDAALAKLFIPEPVVEEKLPGEE